LYEYTSDEPSATRGYSSAWALPSSPLARNTSASAWRISGRKRNRSTGSWASAKSPSTGCGAGCSQAASGAVCPSSVARMRISAMSSLKRRRLGSRWQASTPTVWWFTSIGSAMKVAPSRCSWSRRTERPRNWLSAWTSWTRMGWPVASTRPVMPSPWPYCRGNFVARHAIGVVDAGGGAGCFAPLAAQRSPAVIGGIVGQHDAAPVQAQQLRHEVQHLAHHHLGRQALADQPHHLAHQQQFLGAPLGVGLRVAGAGRGAGVFGGFGHARWQARIQPAWAAAARGAAALC